MTKVRQDAWSHEDDLLLAETVLRHIREGSTQLDAFEEVGDKLNRTGAACGFRWNAIVRKKYIQAIEIAKKQRKQMKRAQQRRPRIWQPAAVGDSTMEAPILGMEMASEDEDSILQPLTPTPFTPAPRFEDDNSLTVPDVIHFLQNLQTDDQTTKRLRRENEALRLQISSLETQIKGLEKEVATMKRDHQAMEEDYQSLIGIMERARRMAFLQEDEEAKSPTFKMDKNGNLEKLAK
jgi:prespore-specific regulator